MTEPDPQPGAEDPGPAGETPASPGPAPGEVPGVPSADPGQPPGQAEEFGPTASIINNFYAEVAAHTVGASQGAGQLGRPAVRRESGVLAAAEVSRALRYYVAPAPFGQARDLLASRHLVALAGPEGCGRKAGTLELVRRACPDAGSYTVLPPTRTLAELVAYKGYRSGQAFLLHDWVPVSSDSGSAARFDLTQLAARLTKAQAYLAITLEGAGSLQALLGEMCVPWSPPDPGALLESCASALLDLRLDDAERGQLRSRAAEIGSPRLIIRLAESAVRSVADALEEAGEGENTAVAAWFAARPARWKIWAVTALAFLSGVGQRRFERQLAALTPARVTGSAPADAGHRDKPGDDDPFPQAPWDLINEAGLGAFISGYDPAAPIGSEHRPAFRTRACRLHFMAELSRRFGDELWGPVRDWLSALADQPFGETQIAAGYGLALLARCALGEVEATCLTPWAAGDLRHRLMTVSVLWSMAEDDQLAPAALKIAVSWVRDRGQERAITAALALGGPLGNRYPSEAMRWLWGLAQRSERIGRVARTAISQLFAVEAEADLEKGTVVRFLLQKIRPLLKPDVTTRERRAALAVAISVLSTTQASAGVPVAAGVLRTRPADFPPVGELWAAVLNSVPHRRDAVRALHLTLTALADSGDSVEVATRLGAVILPRLSARTVEVLEMALPDPDRAQETSARIVAAFLGARRQEIGAAR